MTTRPGPASDNRCIPPYSNVSGLYGLAGGAPDGGLVAVGPGDQPTVPSDCLLAELGLRLTHIGRGRARATMLVARRHLNQRGIAQAGALVALADATAGWATYAAVEHGRFTTLELRTSLLRAARDGDELVAEARPIHLGRRTAILEVDVRRADRMLARFGCTQLILEPEEPSR